VKIGILSDTHNHLANLEAALDLFRARKIETLIHCGDLTSPETVESLEGFRVICAFGNGDIASGEIRHLLLEQDPRNYAGMIFRGEIGGARIAVAHGHIPGQIDALVKSGEHDYVFKGHSHIRNDTTFGFTRLINPGALGGKHVQPRCVCVLDLDDGHAEFVDVAP
jgi:putative phosphoesterase